MTGGVEAAIEELDEFNGQPQQAQTRPEQSVPPEYRDPRGTVFELEESDIQMWCNIAQVALLLLIYLELRGG